MEEKMKKLKLMWNILKKMNVDKIITTYIIFVLICSSVLVKVEPQITNIGDGLWYCFISFTTIGFGDIVAISAIGRIITIIIAIYGVILVAIITGVIVSFYQEINKIKQQESIEEFMDKLEKLPLLSKEELEEISQKIKSRKYRL